MSTQTTHLSAQSATLALVSAAFCSIYLTQPNLPTLQSYFATSLPQVSATVSLLILGFAIANIPFGMAVDRWRLKPLVVTGGSILCLSLLWSANAQSIGELNFSRFLSGLCIPALTTCLVAWLSQTQTAERLPVVMGNYVAATVLGGVGGRLIGGMLFPPDLWRWSFVFVAALIAIATLVAWRTLPDDTENRKPITANGSLADLLKSPNLLMLYACGGTGLALFATVFNYLPYRLTTAPFDLSSTVAAGFYTCYLLGLITAPMAGELSSRFGFGNTLLAGVVLVATALFALMSDELAVTIAALLLLSAGYFTLHSAAVGSLNSKLVAGQGRGRANALYIMFYYIGGSLGIQIGGYIYAWGGWTNLIVFCIVLLLVPLCAAIFEKRNG